MDDSDNPRSEIDQCASDQSDEIDALLSMYPDAVQVLDEGRYLVRIQSEVETEVMFTLPAVYPSSQPLSYQITSPHLSQRQKRILHNRVNDLVLENMGLPLMYLFIQTVQDYLDQVLANGEEETKLNDQDGSEGEGRGEGEDTSYEEELIKDLNATLHHSKQIPTTSTAGRHQSSDSSETEFCPQIISGASMTDRGSAFQGHVAPVHSKIQVHSVLSKLLENGKIARATHNIYAYKITLDSGAVLTDCEDDGLNAVLPSVSSGFAKGRRQRENEPPKGVMLEENGYCSRPSMAAHPPHGSSAASASKSVNKKKKHRS